MARPKHQEGQIAHRGSYWVLRYREDRVGPDGQIKRVKTTKPLAPYADYPYKGTVTDLQRLRQEFNQKIVAILAPVNRGGAATSRLNLGEFIDKSYFPRLAFRLSIPAGNELHIEPSTIKGYKDIFKKHLKNHPASAIQLREFTAIDARRFTESVPQRLSHQTHLRVLNFLRGVFTWAVADGAYHGVNPTEGLKVGGQTKTITEGLTPRQRKVQASNSHAYTLEEVADMLDKLPEPARTVCAVAAFTGLSRSELRGLKWSDYDGHQIRVQRKVWNDQVGATKTEAREEGVYVVPLLQKILRVYKKDFQPGEENWMFRGEKLLRPLDLDNLSRRDIPQYVNGGWFGWHAFRRGLGTRLNEAGVGAKEIQSILRHANVSTTQAYYILPDMKRAEAGLRKIARVARKKYGIKA